MRLASAGTTFLALGLAVGALGVTGIAAGVTVDLPPALQTLITFKLIFIGAVSLLVIGAVLRRRGLRNEATSQPRDDAAPPPQLDGGAEAFHPRQREPLPRQRRP